jgi:hypothetical protein
VNRGFFPPGTRQAPGLSIVFWGMSNEIPRVESQAKRDAMRKARKASAESRRAEADRKRTAIERRARQRTPGHHESCRCELCERSMNEGKGS